MSKKGHHHLVHRPLRHCHSHKQVHSCFRLYLLWGWVGILGFQGSNCGWRELAGCPGQEGARDPGGAQGRRRRAGAWGAGVSRRFTCSRAPAHPQGVAQGQYPGRRRGGGDAGQRRLRCRRFPLGSAPTNTCSEEVSVSQLLGPRTWRPPVPLTSLGPGSLLPLRRPTAFWRQVSLPSTPAIRTKGASQAPLPRPRVPGPRCSHLHPVKKALRRSSPPSSQDDGARPPTTLRGGKG